MKPQSQACEEFGFIPRLVAMLFSHKKAKSIVSRESDQLRIHSSTLVTRVSLAGPKILHPLLMRLI